MKKFLMAMVAMVAMVIVGEAKAQTMVTPPATTPEVKPHVQSKEYSIPAKKFLSGKLTFYAGESVTLALGSSDANLSLLIFDENNKLVGKDISKNNKKFVSFKVSATQKYTIYIVNPNMQDSKCILVAVWK